jgi:hypothetical protein
VMGDSIGHHIVLYACTVVLHVTVTETGRGVIVALFLPPYYY